MMKAKLFLILAGITLVIGIVYFDMAYSKPSGKSKLFTKYTHGKAVDFSRHMRKRISCAKCHKHNSGKMKLQSCKKCHTASSGKKSLKNAFIGRCKTCHDKKGIKP